MKKHIRVLMAKPGLDGHEAGARLISRALADAGMEVIYLGTRQTTEMIVNSAVQESADIIGLSILSGIHKQCARDIMQALNERGAGNLPVVIGGIVPPQDVAELKQIGIRAVFGPGSNMKDVIQTVTDIVENQATV